MNNEKLKEKEKEKEKSIKQNLSESNLDNIVNNDVKKTFMISPELNISTSYFTNKDTSKAKKWRNFKIKHDDLEISDDNLECLKRYQYERMLFEYDI